MTDRATRAAADACPGDDAYARATVTTHQVIAIPAALVGKWVNFAAEGVAVWIRFGTSASVEVDRTAVSAGTPPAITAGTTEAHLYVPAEGSVSRRLQSAWTHFAHESAATTGKLHFCLDQGAYGAD